MYIYKYLSYVEGKQRTEALILSMNKLNNILSHFLSQFI